MNILSIKDIPAPQQFDQLYNRLVNTSDIEDVHKRYVMMINKKKELKIPLTTDELNFLNKLEQK